MRKTRTTRRGVSLIWTALLMVVMIGFVGLACDMGYGMLVAHQLQNAADASATDELRASGRAVWRRVNGHRAAYLGIMAW